MCGSGDQGKGLYPRTRVEAIWAEVPWEKQSTTGACL